MKLAEALVERADLQKRMFELKNQINRNLQVEDGEKPEETVEDLMKEFTELAKRQTKLVAAINRTNSTTEVEDGDYKGLTIMHLLAKRDSIAQVKNQYTALSQESVETSYGRTKDDIKFVLTFSPKAMRKEADKLAKEHREIDTLIQSLNWAVDVVDDLS